MTMASPRIEADRQQILDEIEQLRRDLATRRAFDRRTPRSIVNAYHELLERQYIRLDGINRE
jgi:hypothetical protein